MKKILLLFFIGLLFVNCKKSEVKEIQGEDAFEMQTELIGFNEEAGQYQVTFTANVTKWVATVGEASKEWLTISPTSGGKGEHTLTIKYTANEQTHIRMGE
ncbi:MAG: BACON domain-containing protein, partial [Paludibacteraceae bacterium]|nr:BACON domain-containing protein [Paludibacteraceae bacterium]